MNNVNSEKVPLNRNDVNFLSVEEEDEINCTNSLTLTSSLAVNANATNLLIKNEIKLKTKNKTNNLFQSLASSASSALAATTSTSISATNTDIHRIELNDEQLLPKKQKHHHHHHHHPHQQQQQQQTINLVKTTEHLKSSSNSLTRLFKSSLNSLTSSSTSNNSFSSSSISSDNNNNNSFVTCKICLNKYLDNSINSTSSTCNLNTNNNNNSNSSSKHHQQHQLTNKIYQIESCKCKFCINCLFEYVKHCIENCDVVPVNCPDSNCESKGHLTNLEIKFLIFYLTNQQHHQKDHQQDQQQEQLNSSSSSNVDDLNESDEKLFDTNNNNNYLDNQDDANLINNDKIDISMSINDQSSLKLFKKYLKICENMEILRDRNKRHCPRPNCQNVCLITPNLTTTTTTTTNQNSRTSSIRIKCDKCAIEFCSLCMKKWKNECQDVNSSLNNVEILSLSNTKIQVDKTTSTRTYINDDYCNCATNNNLNNAKNKLNETNLTNIKSINQSMTNLENIKRCPQCSILIERAEGCAQIMCKMCRHTFCFYCLASLDNDFLLKHYTKNGPCKGKLGHSRFSLLMHRVSVVAIFAGSIFLIIILSPFILLSLPCLILSSKCRRTCYKLSAKFS